MVFPSFSQFLHNILKQCSLFRQAAFPFSAFSSTIVPTLMFVYPLLDSSSKPDAFFTPVFELLLPQLFLPPEKMSSFSINIPRNRPPPFWFFFRLTEVYFLSSRPVLSRLFAAIGVSFPLRSLLPTNLTILPQCFRFRHFFQSSLDDGF